MLNFTQETKNAISYKINNVTYHCASAQAQLSENKELAMLHAKEAQTLANQVIEWFKNGTDASEMIPSNVDLYLDFGQFWKALNNYNYAITRNSIKELKSKSIALYSAWKKQTA